MHLVNTTFLVESSLEKQFPSEIEDFICMVEKETDMHSPVLTRVNAPKSEEEPEGTNFALQFRAPTGEAMRKYHDELLPQLFRMLFKRHGEKVLYFTTILDVIR
ncbi:MAG: DUF4286 family protein [Muribaculaceae bacterium]|nr:DUF4286 family protein [Muribaculaceae bacterium]